MKKHLLAPIALAAAAATLAITTDAQASLSITNVGVVSVKKLAPIAGLGQAPVTTGATSKTLGDGVWYDSTENPWQTVLTGNTYVLEVLNNQALGITQKTATVPSAMFVDDIYPDASVVGRQATDITVVVADNASHTFGTTSTTWMNLVLTFWGDNGTGTAPAALLEQVNATTPLTNGDYGYDLELTLDLTLALNTSGNVANTVAPFNALPSLFWVGQQYQSAVTTGVVKTKTTTTNYYVNSMGFGLFSNPSFGSSGSGLWISSTFGNFGANPTSAYGYGDFFYAPGNPSTNIDPVNYPTNLGIEIDGNAVTPEPSTIAALGVGGLAAALRRRRKA